MIDQFYGRVWSPSFTCLAFVAHAWPILSGRPFPDVVAAIDGGLADKSVGVQFKRLAAPHSPCIVSLKGGGDNHTGIFWRGKVLHLTKNGVQYQPLEIAAFAFKRVRFYDVK